MPYLSLRAKVFIIVFLLVTLSTVFLFFSDRDRDGEMKPGIEGEVSSTLVTYRSDEFGFELQHPADWEVRVFPDDPIAPMVNVYKTGQTFEFPLTHHSSATHVSVYPEGIPTEGVFGHTHESGINFAVEIRQSIGHVLESAVGEVLWATYLNPVQNHPKWNAAGFVWGSVRVEDERISCIQNGVEVLEAVCEPFLGDQLVRHGEVSMKDWEVVEEILQSFRFLDGGALADVIVDTPTLNSLITSPLRVEGVARGFWFFEASFPVRLIDAGGNEVAVTPATAEGEWMTSNFVPFTALLVFEEPTTATGFLVFERDNPSGMSEHAAEVRVPVTFR